LHYGLWGDDLEVSIHNHSWPAKMIRWKYAGMIRKIDRRYQSGGHTAERFARYKIYRLLLLRMPEQ